METPYDSTADTLLHIRTVANYLMRAANELNRRAQIHDNSKLESPEKEVFDEFTPLLKDSTYGSEEYKGFMKSMQVALKHHYDNNSHHPQHFENGINDMNLFDLIEMFFDWKAASERHTTGNIFESIRINHNRFHMSDQLRDIFVNTARDLKFYD